MPKPKPESFSAWYGGTRTEWEALPSADREALAFAATGCRIAYPTWRLPVDCVHTGCLIARGVLPAIAQTNSQLRGEMTSGWLRFNMRTSEGRTLNARICRAVRAHAMRTKEYDVWACWPLLVHGGLGAIFGPDPVDTPQRAGVVSA